MYICLKSCLNIITFQKNLLTNEQSKNIVTTSITFHTY